MIRPLRSACNRLQARPAPFRHYQNRWRSSSGAANVGWVVLPGLGTNLIRQKFIPRMFDTSVYWQPSDAERLQGLVSNLIALERKSYEDAMRAIRRFVIGAHRVSDDVNPAYSLSS